MSGTSTIHAHVSYELIDETNPQMVVIEFLTRMICTPAQRRARGTTSFTHPSGLATSLRHRFS